MEHSSSPLDATGRNLWQMRSAASAWRSGNRRGKECDGEGHSRGVILRNLSCNGEIGNDGVYGGCWRIVHHSEYQRGVSDPRTLKEELVRAGSAHAALVFDEDDVAQGWRASTVVQRDSGSSTT
jgi:hypothetical protein